MPRAFASVRAAVTNAATAARVRTGSLRMLLSLLVAVADSGGLGLTGLAVSLQNPAPHLPPTLKALVLGRRRPDGLYDPAQFLAEDLPVGVLNVLLASQLVTLLRWLRGRRGLVGRRVACERNVYVVAVRVAPGVRTPSRIGVGRADDLAVVDDVPDAEPLAVGPQVVGDLLAERQPDRAGGVDPAA